MKDNIFTGNNRNGKKNSSRSGKNEGSEINFPLPFSQFGQKVIYQGPRPRKYSLFLTGYIHDAFYVFTSSRCPFCHGTLVDKSMNPVEILL